MFQPFGGGEVGRIVVAVDPPVADTQRSDACGIIVTGRLGDGAVVLEDPTVRQAAPLDCARRAVRALHAHGADAIVVEVNQGGDLVHSVLAQVDPALPVRSVRATRGKWLRAEPWRRFMPADCAACGGACGAGGGNVCLWRRRAQRWAFARSRGCAGLALTELVLEERRPRIRGL